MSEETRINSRDDSKRTVGADFGPMEERLSNKKLFRIAAELQELLAKRRPPKKRIAASANLTHYVE